MNEVSTKRAMMSRQTNLAKPYTGDQIFKTAQAYGRVLEMKADNPSAVTDVDRLLHVVDPTVATPDQIGQSLSDYLSGLKQRYQRLDSLRADVVAERDRVKRIIEQVTLEILNIARMCQVSSFRGLLGMATLTTAQGGLMVTDENKIPEQYWEVTRTLKRAEIRRAIEQGTEVPGCYIEEPRETLRLNMI